MRPAGRPPVSPATREDLLAVLDVKIKLAEANHRGVECAKPLLEAIRKELEKRPRGEG